VLGATEPGMGGAPDSMGAIFRPEPGNKVGPEKVREAFAAAGHTVSGSGRDTGQAGRNGVSAGTCEDATRFFLTRRRGDGPLLRQSYGGQAQRARSVEKYSFPDSGRKRTVFEAPPSVFFIGWSHQVMKKD
jgi:hypothetical protein